MENLPKYALVSVCAFSFVAWMIDQQEMIVPAWCAAGVFVVAALALKVLRGLMEDLGTWSQRRQNRIDAEKERRRREREMEHSRSLANRPVQPAPQLDPITLAKLRHQMRVKEIENSGLEPVVIRSMIGMEKEEFRVEMEQLIMG